MKIKKDGSLDRLVRHLTSEWGWPGAVLLLGGLSAFVIRPSIEWLDYAGVPDTYERVTALAVAVLGLVWIVVAAAYYRTHARDRRSSRSRRP